MKLIEKYKSLLNVSTFFKIEIGSILFLIILVCFFGIQHLYKTHEKTVILTSMTAKEQHNLNRLNQNLFKLFAEDERVFSKALSNEDIDSSFNNLILQKEVVLSLCDSTELNKQLIDSLFQEKEFLVRRYQEINHDKIEVRKLYVKDTTLQYVKVNSIIPRKKLETKVSYKIDPTKLKKELGRFNNDRNSEINHIITKNAHMNVVIKDEVYNYIDKITNDMYEHHEVIQSEIRNTIKRFMICCVVILGLIIICLRVLIYDLNKVFKSTDRKDSFISELIQKFKK